MMIRLAPSILSADLYCLKDDIDRVLSCGVDMVHVDVMDGHFVPNITFGLPLVSALRKHTDALLDVHLMITDPNRYAPMFAKAGADIVTVHVESSTMARTVISAIRKEGAKVGITLNPPTPIGSLEPYLDDIDQVLVMSVQAGFGGQSFMEGTLQRIVSVHETLRGKGADVPIEVDGGIGPTNAPSVVSAGASILVAGSSIFAANGGDIEGNVRAMRDSLMLALGHTF